MFNYKIILKVFIFPLTLSTMLCITGCKDYSAESIIWINDIEKGTIIENIINTQPNFIEVNWEKPDTINSKLYYQVMVKSNPNILNKTHSLVFIDGRFQGCSHHHK